jgi:hypothetical protein
MAIVLVLQLHYQLACVTVPTIAGKVMAARDAVLTVVHIGSIVKAGTTIVPPPTPNGPARES